MLELARDSLKRTGRYEVTDGIISPVSDSYPKKVHYIFYFISFTDVTLMLSCVLL